MAKRVRVANGARFRATLMALTALLCAGATLMRAEPASFADVMRRAHAYVVSYEDHQLSTVIAREIYDQQWLDAEGHSRGERRLLSDYLLLQLPPDEDWFALRDVYEVDGVLVGDRAARLEALFAEPRERLSDRAMAIAAESARFNLAGDFYFRTINLPTFALRILRPASRTRFVFRKAGEEQVEGMRTWVISYRETKGPTFSGTPEGRDLPAHGRFWVEPETGVIRRSEMILGGTRQVPGRVTITVSYRLDPTLEFQVPIQMQERYDNPRRKRDDLVVALATYSDFRRFDSRSLVRRAPREYH